MMCYVFVKRNSYFHLYVHYFCYTLLEPPKGGGEGLMHVTRTLRGLTHLLKVDILSTLQTEHIFTISVFKTTSQNTHSHLGRTNF